MSRHLVAAAQLGPIHRADSRESVVRRLVDLMRQAADRGCRLVVYPELALTTFFPRWLYDSQDEVDAWFEHEMPNAATRPLFDEAKRLGIGFHLGYAELCEEDGATRRFNTAILVGPDGAIVGKYRKIHLPGTAEPVPDAPFQHLEKRYFEVGNLGFPVWRAHSGGTQGVGRKRTGTSTGSTDQPPFLTSSRLRAEIQPRVRGFGSRAREKCGRRAVGAPAAAKWCNVRPTPPLSPRAGCRWRRQWPALSNAGPRARCCAGVSCRRSGPSSKLRPHWP